MVTTIVNIAGGLSFLAVIGFCLLCLIAGSGKDRVIVKSVRIYSAEEWHELQLQETYKAAGGMKRAS